MKYKKVVARRQVGKYHKSSDGRYFIRFLCDDNKIYQVKFNLINTKGNQNELITHFVGNAIKAPVLEGRMIEFSKRVLDMTVATMKKIVPNADLSFYKSNQLFGIEWHEGARHAESEEEVADFYAMCKNRDAFYSIYPFDQYLRNYDRQHFNHLMVKIQGDRKPTHFYAAIDGDRIFGSTGWDMVTSEKTTFDCFPKPFHSKLYGLISDDKFNHVQRHAVEINNMTDDVVDNLGNILESTYSAPKSENGIILEALKFRRDNFNKACSGSCFPNVKHKLLIEDERDHGVPTI